MCTRVMYGAGEQAKVKQALQLNFDEFDSGYELYIIAKHQDVFRDCSSCGLSVAFLPSRESKRSQYVWGEGAESRNTKSLGWGREQTSFAEILLYLRFLIERFCINFLDPSDSQMHFQIQSQRKLCCNST